MISTHILKPIIANQLVSRAVLPPEIFNSFRVSKAINYIGDRWPESSYVDSSDLEKPIFVFSAGWGSGSTLVQRLIISSKKYLIWGEPFDHSAPIHRMSGMITPINDSWPPDYHFNAKQSLDALSNDWVANLSPEFETLRKAHRSFLSTWLSGHYEDSDVQWGLKEVRLTIDHARYLKWLFPEAKFVFIVRDIYNCYLSCRRVPWFSIWPDYKVAPILHFAHHWKYLANGFFDRHGEVGGLLIKYEELIRNPSVVDEIVSYLDLGEINTNIMDKPVGNRGQKRHPLILPEKMLLDGVTSDVRAKFGYR